MANFCAVTFCGQQLRICLTASTIVLLDNSHLFMQDKKDRHKIYTFAAFCCIGL